MRHAITRKIKIMKIKIVINVDLDDDKLVDLKTRHIREYLVAEINHAVDRGLLTPTEDFVVDHWECFTDIISDRSDGKGL